MESFLGKKVAMTGGDRRRFATRHTARSTTAHIKSGLTLIAAKAASQIILTTIVAISIVDVGAQNVAV